MTEQLPEIFRAASVAATLLILIAARLSKPLSSPLPGWPFIIVGFGLLLFDSALAMSEYFTWPVLDELMPYPSSKLWMRNLVGSVGGFLFLLLGLIRLMPNVQLAPGSLDTIRQELETSKSLLNSVLKSSLSGVMILRAVRDRSRSIVDLECLVMNAAAEQLLGIPASRIVGAPVSKRLPCIVENDLLREAVSVIETGLPSDRERNLVMPGGRRWFHISATRNGEGLCVTFAEISDRKRNEERLRHAAQHDALTGLPNRALFLDRVERAITRSNRIQGYHFAVLYLDFDRFKIINDSLGHDIGDQLLISIAQRLQENLRAIDGVVREGEHLPARLGGDEFVILLDGLQEPKNVLIIAERLLKDLAAPHRIAGHQIISTASIGIVTSEGHYTRADDVIRDADTAMYRAKTKGKAQHVIFDDEMRRSVVERLHLENALRDAVERRAFLLEYQPIVCLRSGRIVGFEALVRWNHPDRGKVRPAEFIPLAEELGLMVPIGEWVMTTAAKALRRLQNHYRGEQPLTMNVNFSKQELLRPDLLKTLRRVTKSAQIAPEHFKIEITESIVMQNVERMSALLGEIRAAGIRIVMDDFGTGYSSLGCLHELPFDELKIDRSFLGDGTRTRDYAAIVHAVTELARNLNISVVVEGVETQDQLSMLQALDCDFGQGWLFSDSVSVEAAIELLAGPGRINFAA